MPLRGSLSVLAGVSMLYLLVALGIGLLISSATKSQFVASQITLLVTFLPAMMLSGFLFDLRSMPVGGAAGSPTSLPARYLRGAAADRLSRRRCLGRDPAQRRRAGRDGGGRCSRWRVRLRRARRTRREVRRCSTRCFASSP